MFYTNFVLQQNKRNKNKKNPSTSFYRKKWSLKVEAYLSICLTFITYLASLEWRLIIFVHLATQFPNNHSLEIHYIEIENFVQQNQEKPPKEATPPASSFAYEKQEPIELEQLSQYQTPCYFLQDKNYCYNFMKCY